MTTIKIPKNDSAVFKFRVKLADGSFVNFAGYDVVMRVKNNLEDLTYMFEQDGEVGSPDTTYALVRLPYNTASEVGVWPAALRAEHPQTQEAHTYPFMLQVEDHAA